MPIHEPAREIPVIHETEVLVVGSGPGGLAAALGAARAGSGHLAGTVWVLWRQHHRGRCGRFRLVPS